MTLDHQRAEKKIAATICGGKVGRRVLYYLEARAEQRPIGNSRDLILQLPEARDFMTRQAFTCLTEEKKSQYDGPVI